MDLPQASLKELSDKETDWGYYITEYVFSHTDGLNFKTLTNIEEEVILDLVFRQAIAISPTLFCELFDPRREMEIISVLLFQKLQLRNVTTHTNLIMAYQASMLASFISDARLYPDQKGKNF